ncbi:MAG: glycine betaine/L-proline ABC transporter ATP-binding protein [Trueperaceae bacterium]
MSSAERANPGQQSPTRVPHIVTEQPEPRDGPAAERNIKLATRNLSKVFGPRPERALEILAQGGSKADAQKIGAAVGVYDANIDIREGETFVLMGLSGSGKSTLLRMFNRLHEPTVGQVLVDGLDITGLNRRELLEVRREKFSGMVFQQFAILPHRTVVDNVAYGLEVQGVNMSQRQRRAREATALVGLEGWEEYYPSELSGGMQQRVGLARALAVDADILLMDEAFSALDPLIRREMQDELVELQARVNKTIVFVTHDLDEALKLGDRIAIMKDARVVQVGTAEEILTHPADDYVEAFVEGVDRASVLTASNIMQPVKETAFLRDGPNTVRTKMRRHGLSGIIVTDSERKVQGYITSEAVRAQIEDQAADRERLDRARVVPATTVGLQTPLQDIIGIASEASVPIGVVDPAGRLRGVVVKGAILAALVRPGNTDQNAGAAGAVRGEAANV